jgi:hypothetical protein
LGEGQWELIAPLLPKHKRRGRPRAAFFECFAPVPAGKTTTKVRQPVPLATSDSKSGKTRESGDR